MKIKHPGDNIRILIVDDDEDILANLSDILSDVGYETETASCGEDAILKFESCLPSNGHPPYDLCLLDFKMPGIDGVELYQRMLQHDPRQRAIMVTAYAGEDGVERALKAGTWKVLHKPVNIGHLLDLIREAVA